MNQCSCQCVRALCICIRLDPVGTYRLSLHVGTSKENTGIVMSNICILFVCAVYTPSRICVHAHIQADTHTHTHTHAHTHTHTHTHPHTHTHTDIYIYIYIYMPVYKYESSFA